MQRRWEAQLESKWVAELACFRPLATTTASMGHERGSETWLCHLIQLSLVLNHQVVEGVILKQPDWVCMAKAWCHCTGWQGPWQQAGQQLPLPCRLPRVHELTLRIGVRLRARRATCRSAQRMHKGCKAVTEQQGLQGPRLRQLELNQVVGMAGRETLIHCRMGSNSLYWYTALSRGVAAAAGRPARVQYKWGRAPKQEGRAPGETRRSNSALCFIMTSYIDESLCLRRRGRLHPRG